MRILSASHFKKNISFISKKYYINYKNYFLYYIADNSIAILDTRSLYHCGTKSAIKDVTAALENSAIDLASPISRETCSKNNNLAI